MIEFRRILVPIDFGDSSRRALEVAGSLASRTGATVILFHTYEIPALIYEGMMVSPLDLLTPVHEAAQRQFDVELGALRTRAPRAKGILVTGSPWQEILKVAKDEDVDLIVMGTHGRRGITHAIIGSVAEKIVRLSSVPVLTVRASTEEEAGSRSPIPAHSSGTPTS